MTNVSQKIMKERLAWVERARRGLFDALEDSMHQQVRVYPTVDPLRFILKVTLNNPIAKASRAPLRQYLRCVAATSDCEIPSVNITDNWIQAEVLTQRRHVERDGKGRFKGPRRFERRPG